MVWPIPLCLWVFNIVALCCFWIQSNNASSNSTSNSTASSEDWSIPNGNPEGWAHKYLRVQDPDRYQPRAGIVLPLAGEFRACISSLGRLCRAVQELYLDPLLEMWVVLALIIS